MRKIVKATSPEETENFGKKLGKALKGGEVIELASDLGGGKTTLTRGIASGAGSSDHVSSPTFTISNLYEAGELTIHHFDFYRLQEAGLMEYELEDVLGHDDEVVIVEWSDVVAHVLPEDRVTIHIVSNGDDARVLTIDYPESWAYLLEEL
jgi:tRNA threonylcarbamoyladenosine biosynthesis protein TsaE